MRDLIQEILNCFERNTPIVLVTIVEATGSTPGRVGGKMLVYKDGSIKGTVGGGLLEGKVIEESLRAIENNQPFLLSYNLTERESAGLGMVCGGHVKVFVEPFLPQPHLIIAGGGHISQNLCPLAKKLNYEVTIIDDRKEFVNKQKFPDADHLNLGNIDEVLRHSNIHPQTYIVLVTRGHACDEEALHAIIDSPAAYLGMIGSQRKVKVVFDNLCSKGVSSELLKRVKAPIGLNIGGDTPAEIAVSIMAQIQKFRYKKGDTTEELNYENPYSKKY